MCLTEFDEKKYEQVVRDDARAFLVFSLVSRGRLTLEEGAEELDMDIRNFERAMREADYGIPDSV